VVADEARGLARPAGSPGAGMDEPPTGLARLRNIGERVAAALESLTGRDARHAVLGHVQRGGEPTAADRVLATRFGAAAVDFIRASQFGVMASLRDGGIVPVPLERVAGRTRALAQDDDLLRTARRVGMCLG